MQILFWVILALALFLRAAYLLELRRTPFFDRFVLDLAAYDDWGLRIAAGDWLGSRVFYQDPLYSYFLGFLYWLLGHRLILVYLLQALAGTATCAIIYSLGRSYFSPAAGLLAALGAALYKPFIFYDIQIEKSFLAVLLVGLACFGFQRAWVSGASLGWLAAGIALGLTILIRGNFLLLVPFLLAGIALGLKGKGRIRALVWYGAGVAIILGATLVRNYAVAHDWVLTTSQAGQNLFIGNNPDNITGMYRAPDFVRPDPRHEEEDFAREAERLSGRPLRPSEVSSFWMRRALAFMRDEPWRFLSLFGRKILLFWNAYEIPDNLDQYFMERYSVVMRLWLPGFGIVAPLGLAGMLLCRRDIQRLWPLYTFAACYFLSVILFYVFSRYRLPVVPFLLLFAGQACLQLVELCRRRRLKSLAVGALGIVALAVAVHAPLVQAFNPSALTNLGAVLIEQGDIDAAESLMRHVIDRRPEYADAHNNLGVVLTRRGKLTEAVDHLREAVRLRPRHSNAYINLGGALRRARDYRGALEALGKAGEVDPGSALVWQGTGQVRREMGDYAGAVADLKRAMELDPDSAGIRNDLGIALLGLGHTVEALAVLSEGSGLQPGMAELAFNRGIALERLGRKAEALAAYGRAVSLRGDFAEAYNNLGNLLAETGDIEGALSAYRNCLRHWKGDARTAEAVRKEVRRLERSGAGNR